MVQYERKDNMKLLTKEILAKLPKLHETDGKEKKFVVKFFTPDANWTWYAVEGEEEGVDVGGLHAAWRGDVRAVRLTPCRSPPGSSSGRPWLARRSTR